MENDCVHIRPRLELPLPVCHGRQRSHNQKWSGDAIVKMQDPQKRHRLQGAIQSDMSAAFTVDMIGPSLEGIKHTKFHAPEDSVSKIEASINHIPYTSLN